MKPICNLKQILEDKQLSQIELARQLDLNQGHLSRIISSQREPKVGIAHQIATHLKLTIEDLFKW